MSYEVVVVGAGLGGLTAGALLAARGLKVCVIERESRAGGCAASFEKFGYTFEPTAGLYSGWGEGETHARLFAQLPVAPPRARRLSHAYTVRLGDHTEVRVGAKENGEFADDLCAAFPECAAFAVDLYSELQRLADADEAARAQTSSRIARPRTLLGWKIGGRGKGSKDDTENRDDEQSVDDKEIVAARAETVTSRLVAASPRLRSFIDAQLQLFASCAGDECSLLVAAHALTLPLGGLYALAGGAQAQADALAESIKMSGGTVRFDTTALRLARDAAGEVVGVDLLSGETVRASRAVVSNLTAWDTYGKLVGASRTPADVRARLKNLRGSGAYLVLFGMDESAASRLPSERMILVNDSVDDGAMRSTFDATRSNFDATRSMFALNVAPRWDARAPEGKRAATLAAFTDAAEWFAYHEDEAEHEAQDERALAFWWERLHAALPEIGDGAEVIETMTPRSYYEQTRRRLGAVWGLARTPETLIVDSFNQRAHLPKLYLVGDTVASANGVEAVTRNALAVADEIAPQRK
jgi:phytoene dehydrogenase-like protein